VKIGVYEVEAVLGRGAAGVVHRARAADGSPVALKALVRGDDAALRRFEREIRLQLMLGESSGFVPVLATGIHAGKPFLVMPLLEGGTLRDRLARGPLGVAETIELGRSIARALGEAHARGIVHRDLKPENVLFSGAGRPLVADLGLAKHFDDSALGASQSHSVSQSGSFRGTIGYMPPEQMHDAKTAGPAADVFALGVVLYECLVGRKPFEGETVLELVERVEEGSFARIRRFRPDVPAGIASAIERALASRPRERFTDGLAFERALRATRGPPRRPLLLATGLAALALAAGIVVVAMRVPSSPAPAKKEGPNKAAALAKEAYLELLHDHAARALALANDAVAADPGDGSARAVLALVEQDGSLQDKALADADAALALAPRSPLALLARACTRGTPAERLRAADEALELDPSLAYAYFVRAGVEWNQGDLKASFADVTRLLDRDPRSGRAWVFRAQLRSEDDVDGVIADYTRAIELAPKTAGLYLGRGGARWHEGDRDGALADANAAIEYGPDLALAWFLRARLELDAGDRLPETVADSTRAIALAPRDVQSWTVRAAARRRLGDRERSLSDMVRALELGPDRPDVLIDAAASLADAGALAKARAAYERFLRVATPDHRMRPDAESWLARHPERDDPPVAETAAELADEAARQGRARDLSGAVACLTSAIALEPANASYWSERARWRSMGGAVATAEDDACQAIELDPLLDRAWLGRGVLRAARGDHEGSLADLTRWIEMDPGEPAAWIARSGEQLAVKDARAALADAAAAVRADPSFPKTWRCLGDALDAVGDADAARAAFEIYVAMEPEDPGAAAVRARLGRPPR
jgi:tetratricopeptide (TPR) repeat protein